MLKKPLKPLEELKINSQEGNNKYNIDKKSLFQTNGDSLI